MKKILLDSNVIIRFPDILGLTIDDTRIIIPSSIVSELNYLIKDNTNLFELINESINLGHIDVSDSFASLNERMDQVGLKNLSFSDKALVALALELKESGDEVFIASQDKAIQQVAKDKNLEFLNWDSIEELLKSNKKKSTSNPINLKITDFKKQIITNSIISIAVGVISSLVATKFVDKLDVIVDYINIWGTLLAILIFGVFLFIAREKYRLAYGIFEVMVGMIVIVSLFIPVKFDYSKLVVDLSFNLKLIGGLYIMVRGQDNIMKALTGTRFSLWFNSKIIKRK